MSPQLRVGIAGAGVGGSFHLFPNALRALEWAGLSEAVFASLDESAHLTIQTFQAQDGKLLVEWPIGRDFDLPTLSVVRGEVHEVLAQNADIRLNSAVESWEDDGDGVTVQLAGGGSERFDILIGADGLRSRVREPILGKAEPVYTGYVTWLATIP